jgi:hypothetical protein
MRDQPRTPRIRLCRLPDDLLDAAAKPPDVVLFEGRARITIDAAEKKLHSCVGRLLPDRLSFGALVTALKRDVAWKKKPTWTIVAIAVGLCEAHSSTSAKKNAAQKIRNDAAHARRFYGASAALQEGRRIFADLKEECRDAVSLEDFKSALDVLEK